MIEMVMVEVSVVELVFDHHQIVVMLDLSCNRSPWLCCVVAQSE